MERVNVGTKGKSPKQDLTSAKDLTIELCDKKIKESLNPPPNY